MLRGTEVGKGRSQIGKSVMFLYSVNDYRIDTLVALPFFTKEGCVSKVFVLSDTIFMTSYLECAHKAWPYLSVSSSSEILVVRYAAMIAAHPPNLSTQATLSSPGVPLGFCKALKIALDTRVAMTCGAAIATL